MTQSLEPPSKSSPLRIIAAGLMLVAGACYLAFAMSGSDAANRDYVSYWAAGQQLVHHRDPYDAASILAIERSVGYSFGRPILMRNPPSAFFLALPLGFVSERTGAIVWSLALIAALMLSIRMIWLMQGRPQDRLHLVGYLFPPALACLLAGQIGIFILLGVTLFLFFHQSRPYVAGAALLLCALKVHLFLPIGVVLFAWILSRRVYAVLAGAAIAVLASLFLVPLLDPAAWTQYARMIAAEDIRNEFLPCISLVFRVVVRRSAISLQLVPSVTASIWALRYFWVRRQRWDWNADGPLLLVVSLAVAPYAWFTDETVVLPAILIGLYRASSRSLVLFACIAGVALVEVLAGAPLSSWFYIWTAPAWLAWYLLAVRSAEPADTFGLPTGDVAARPGSVVFDPVPTERPDSVPSSP